LFKKDYFKGWYFKCFSENKTLAFIPAFHSSGNQETASVQIITDNAVFNIPFNSLKYRENPLCIVLENCVFSKKGIDINFKNDKLTVSGNLKFSAFSPLRYDIMGPFKFIPFMECRHSVYSMRHIVDGEIIINGQLFNFQNSLGYIEGDCGRSFPEKYIWTQCCFENCSLMLSVANIPFGLFCFTGIIGVVMLNGKQYRIATYLGAKVKSINENSVIVTQGNYKLCATLIKKNSLPLYAPISGKMDRTIHESASCEARYIFSYRGKVLYQFTSNRASFEFEYT